MVQLYRMQCANCSKLSTPELQFHGFILYFTHVHKTAIINKQTKIDRPTYLPNVYYSINSM